MNKMKLVELGRDYALGEIDAYKFSESICVERRKLYGLSGREQNVMDCGEELFMLAEIYNPDNDRADYELDEDQLLDEVKATLLKFKLI